MTIATLMVYVDAAQQAEEQVRVARAVANMFGASVIGVSAIAVPPPVVSDGVVIQAVTADDVKMMKATVAGKEDWFRTVIGLPREKLEWRGALADPGIFLANEARAADLVVLKSWQKAATAFNSWIRPKRSCGWAVPQSSRSHHCRVEGHAGGSYRRSARFAIPRNRVRSHYYRALPCR